MVGQEKVKYSINTTIEMLEYRVSALNKLIESTKKDIDCLNKEINALYTKKENKQLKRCKNGN